VLSAPEDDPEGAVYPRQVQDVIRSHGRLFNLRVAGRIIPTTEEHPFFVKGKGWLPTKSLMAGDLLRSHDGRWTPVEAVKDTGEDVPVYNLRVADYHTYFVGSPEWGFSVWAHNNNICPVDLYSAGGGPNGNRPYPQARPGDFGVPRGGPFPGTVGPEVPPTPQGLSTFNSLENLQSQVGGHVYMIPAGTELPPGFNVVHDAGLTTPGGYTLPTGHYTIFPETQMSGQQFQSGLAGLPWQYQGNFPK
jgi:hypothetical protein